MRNPYRWHDQKTRIAHHSPQVGAARSVAPPDPLITCLQPPRRRRKCQGSDPSDLRPHQIALLCTAQGASAIRMKSLQQRSPLLCQGPVLRAQRNQLYSTKDGERTGAIGCLQLSLCCRCPKRWRDRSRDWQDDLSESFQAKQGLASIHLLRPAVRVAPVQQTAQMPRQAAPSAEGILLHQRLQPSNNRGMTCRIEPIHRASDARFGALCPVCLIVSPLGEGSRVRVASEPVGLIYWDCSDPIHPEPCKLLIGLNLARTCSGLSVPEATCAAAWQGWTLRNGIARRLLCVQSGNPECLPNSGER